MANTRRRCVVTFPISMRLLVLLFLAQRAQMLLQHLGRLCAIKRINMCPLSLCSSSLHPHAPFLSFWKLHLKKMPDVDTTRPHKPAPELDLVPLAKLTRITIQRLAPFCQIRLPCASFSLRRILYTWSAYLEMTCLRFLLYTKPTAKSSSWSKPLIPACLLLN